MFSWTKTFNQDLTRWDVRNVKDKRHMFDFADDMEQKNKPKFKLELQKNFSY